MRLLAGVVVAIAVLATLAAMVARGRRGGSPGQGPSAGGLVNGLLLLGAFVLVVLAVVVLRTG